MRVLVLLDPREAEPAEVNLAYPLAWQIAGHLQSQLAGTIIVGLHPNDSPLARATAYQCRALSRVNCVWWGQTTGPPGKPIDLRAVRGQKVIIVTKTVDGAVANLRTLTDKISEAGGAVVAIGTMRGKVGKDGQIKCGQSAVPIISAVEE